MGLRGPKIVYGHQGAHRCAPVAFRTMTRTTCAVGEAIPGYQRDDIVYLDWNATTPIFPEVTAAMQPFFSTSFGNPSSSHLYAKPTREALARAREAVARVVNAPSDDAVVFGALTHHLRA